MLKVDGFTGRTALVISHAAEMPATVRLPMPRRQISAIGPIFLAVMTMLAGSVHAGDINVDNPDVAVRWDNTVKYSTAVRLQTANPVLLSNPNDDDGDRNFGKGIISDRLDVFSELDVIYRKSMGLRLSAAGWYDTAYMGSNDNPGFAGGAFPNQVSVPYNQFTAGTRDVNGRKVVMMDAFVFNKFDLGDESATIRIGQHSLLWGESLFFGANAIAGGMMPVDVNKLQSVPGTLFKEAILPVPQVSGQVQLNSNVSVGAYVQTDFIASRLPGVGSYFSNTDPAPAGGESLLLGPGVPPALRTADIDPKRSGQGGVQLKLRGDQTDYGFYAIHFDEKMPQLVVNLVPVPGAPAGTAMPGSYTLVYPQGITAYGASMSRTFGNYNVAIEGSIHQNQDLASSQAANLAGLSHPGVIFPATNNTNNPGYAVGETAHINLSTLGALDSNLLWREATLTAELAWNRVLSITQNAAAVDPNATRDGVAMRAILEPTYRGVFDGIDIGVPVGLGWAPYGSRPMAVPNPNAWIPAGGGDLSIGLNISVHDAWRATLTYVHYYGPAATFNDAAENNAYSWGQTLADRDFISASLRYSF